jgi:hypothetical protein
MRSLTFCVHLKVALQHSNYMPSWYNSWPFRCDCVLGTAKQDLQPRHMQHRVPTATAASSFSFVSVQYLPFSCPLLSAPAHAIWPDGRTRFWRRPRFVWLSSVDCWFSPELAGTSGNRCRWLHSGSTSTTMARTGPTVLPVSVWIWAPEQQSVLSLFSPGHRLHRVVCFLRSDDCPWQQFDSILTVMPGLPVASRPHCCTAWQISNCMCTCGPEDRLSIRGDALLICWFRGNNACSNLAQKKFL